MADMKPAPLRILGAPGSPYTRKMIALLRYRRTPHHVIWGSHRNAPPSLPEPKTKLLPVLYLPGEDGGMEALVDSTPLIRKLEALFPGRSVLPGDPVLALINELIEDYADEWLTKAMFHYRWAFAEDRDNAAPLLVYWMAPTMPAQEAAAAANAFSDRQTARLAVVGSNALTAHTIEQSYRQFLAVLDDLIGHFGYVMGGRPAAADFAIYGQLTQLGVIEPTSAAIMARYPRIRAWLDRVEDLSGLEPVEGDWISRDDAEAALTPMLAQIGRFYAPFMLANARAVQAGAATVEVEIDGRVWSQAVFPYQAKCLAALRSAYAGLVAADRAAADRILGGSGCHALFDPEDKGAAS